MATTYHLSLHKQQLLIHKKNAILRHRIIILISIITIEIKVHSGTKIKYNVILNNEINFERVICTCNMNTTNVNNNILITGNQN